MSFNAIFLLKNYNTHAFYLGNSDIFVALARVACENQDKSYVSCYCKLSRFYFVELRIKYRNRYGVWMLLKCLKFQT